MKISPLIRARRAFKNMSHFRCVLDGDVPSYAAALPIGSNELLIGVYENQPPTLQGCVAVTNRRLLVERDGTWESAEYHSILEVKTPSPAEAQAGKLSIELSRISLPPLSIPINGRKAQCFDLFEFSRFISRVCEDLSASDIN